MLAKAGYTKEKVIRYLLDNTVVPADEHPNTYSASPNPEKLKLQRATEEFEAILLSSWWEQMQKSFPAASESEQEPGFDTLRELSYRALAVALASRGGIGVASLMLRQLEPALPNSPPATQELKTKTG
jgi:Rod binding domain-containing protein